MSCRSFVVFALALAGCKKPALVDPPPDAAGPVAVASSSVLASVPSTAPPPPPPDPKSERRLYRAAFARGHAAAARADWADAVTAFDEAVAHGIDARALGERGYAKLQLEDLEGAEHDFEAARALGAPAATAAQIWYNLGLVRELRGDADAARTAFATSQSLRRTTAAAAKLQGLSSCLARISRGRPISESSLSAARSWSQTWEQIRTENIVGELDGAPDAKHAVCMRTTSAEKGTATFDACDGPPPWIVSHERYWFTWHEHAIFPSLTAKDKVFTVDLGMAGGWALKCQGTTSSKAESHDWVGHVATTYDGHDGVVMDQEATGSGALDLVCGTGTGSITDTFFDQRSGAFLLQVERTVEPGAQKPLSTLSFTGRVVEISGGACHERIDFDAKGAPTRAAP